MGSVCEKTCIMTQISPCCRQSHWEIQYDDFRVFHRQCMFSESNDYYKDTAVSLSSSSWKLLPNLMMKSRPWLFTFPRYQLDPLQEMRKGQAFYQPGSVWKHTKWRRINFYTRLWRAWGMAPQQSFSTNSSITSNRTRFAFFRCEIFLASIRLWTHWKTLSFLCPHKIYWYWWKESTHSLL